MQDNTINLSNRENYESLLLIANECYKIENQEIIINALYEGNCPPDLISTIYQIVNFIPDIPYNFVKIVNEYHLKTIHNYADDNSSNDAENMDELSSLQEELTNIAIEDNKYVNSLNTESHQSELQNTSISQNEETKSINSNQANFDEQPDNLLSEMLFAAKNWRVHENLMTIYDVVFGNILSDKDTYTIYQALKRANAPEKILEKIEPFFPFEDENEDHNLNSPDELNFEVGKLMQLTINELSIGSNNSEQESNSKLFDAVKNCHIQSNTELLLKELNNDLLDQKTKIYLAAGILAANDLQATEIDINLISLANTLIDSQQPAVFDLDTPLTTSNSAKDLDILSPQEYDKIVSLLSLSSEQNYNFIHDIIKTHSFSLQQRDEIIDNINDLFDKDLLSNDTSRNSIEYLGKLKGDMLDCKIVCDYYDYPEL